MKKLLLLAWVAPSLALADSCSVGFSWNTGGTTYQIQRRGSSEQNANYSGWESSAWFNGNYGDLGCWFTMTQQPWEFEQYRITSSDGGTQIGEPSPTVQKWGAQVYGVVTVGSVVWTGGIGYNPAGNTNFCDFWVTNGTAKAKVIDVAPGNTNSIAGYASAGAGALAFCAINPSLCERYVVPAFSKIKISPSAMFRRLGFTPTQVVGAAVVGFGMYVAEKALDDLFNTYGTAGLFAPATAPVHAADSWCWSQPAPLTGTRTAAEDAAQAAYGSESLAGELAKEQARTNGFGTNYLGPYSPPDISGSVSSLDSAGLYGTNQFANSWDFYPDRSWWLVQIPTKTNIVSLYPPEAVGDIWDWRGWLKAVLGSLLAFEAFKQSQKDFWRAIAGGFSGAGVQIPNMQSEILGNGGNVAGVAFASVSAASVTLSIVAAVAMAGALGVIATEMGLSALMGAPPVWFNQIGWFLTETTPLKLALWLLYARVALWGAGFILFKRFIIQAVNPR